MAMVTSADAARCLFGQTRYQLYLAWFSTLAQPDQAKYYDSHKQWREAISAAAWVKAGDFPTTRVFKYFTQYLSLSGDLFPVEPSGDGSTTPDSLTASRCLHTLHPGDDRENVTLCSVCIMQQRVTSLDKIWNVWKMLRGPFKPTTNKKLWVKVKKVWRFEKHRWANDVLLYEDIATKELAWENTHSASPEALQPLKDVKSCQEALRVAWTCCDIRENVPYSFIWRGSLKDVRYFGPQQPEQFQQPSAIYSNTTSEDFPKASSPESMTAPYSSLESRCMPLQQPELPPLILRKKCVTFLSDTVEHQSCDTLSYNRRHSSYNPGRYASAPGFDKVDTSFTNDSSYGRPDADQVTQDSVAQTVETEPPVPNNDEYDMNDDPKSHISDHCSMINIGIDSANGCLDSKPIDIDNRESTAEATAEGRTGDDGDVLMEDSNNIDSSLLIQGPVALRHSRAQYEEDLTASDRPRAEIKRPRFRGSSRMRLAFETELKRHGLDALC
ncbi:hypothetical protein K491DRAFT_438179 [Lophiostoma macrostomum CBS 122681]|uniref:Uncharacterized protein n=1 Tax=Lophiostoma macrostomum CBS 122681 TaxID=1314788 RepID=A0A6A6T750_9PLEO|nr:hypothetical protein K491DRAFT_438179 [Lophiostoma macrostomum CBS 122681]